MGTERSRDRHRTDQLDSAASAKVAHELVSIPIDSIDSIDEVASSVVSAPRESVDHNGDDDQLEDTAVVMMDTNESAIILDADEPPEVSKSRTKTKPDPLTTELLAEVSRQAEAKHATSGSDAGVVHRVLTPKR